MKIAELMTMDVASCAPADSLSRAAQLMWERDCGCVPVLDGEKVVGMITDRDICMSTMMQGRSPAQVRVDQAMSREVFSCSPDDSIDAAAKVMRHRQVRRLPVLDGNGKLVGIVSLNDLALRATQMSNLIQRNHEIRVVEQTLEAVSRSRAMMAGPRT